METVLIFIISHTLACHRPSSYPGHPLSSYRMDLIWHFFHSLVLLQKYYV